MSFRLLAILGMFALLPGFAWAGSNPDFNQDAIPILGRQPHLVEFVRNHYDVKGKGEAKAPGNENHPPGPPYIFEARPLHSDGPFYLRLLIQPGQPGRILKVVDIRKVHLHEPASQPAQQQRTAPSNPPSPGGATGASPAEPTAETPSGPIKDSSSDASDPAPNDSGKPALTPPPDPAPATP